MKKILTLAGVLTILAIILLYLRDIGNRIADDLAREIAK